MQYRNRWLNQEFLYIVENVIGHRNHYQQLLTWNIGDDSVKIITRILGDAYHFIYCYASYLDHIFRLNHSSTLFQCLHLYSALYLVTLHMPTCVAENAPLSTRSRTLLEITRFRRFFLVPYGTHARTHTHTHTHTLGAFLLCRPAKSQCSVLTRQECIMGGDEGKYPTELTKTGTTRRL